MTPLHGAETHLQRECPRAGTHRSAFCVPAQRVTLSGSRRISVECANGFSSYYWVHIFNFLENGAAVVIQLELEDS